MKKKCNEDMEWVLTQNVHGKIELEMEHCGID